MILLCIAVSSMLQGLLTICHIKLLGKLIEHNMPPIIIRFLTNIYSHQVAYVHWNSCLSDSSVVSNGIRQGRFSSRFTFLRLHNWFVNAFEGSGVRMLRRL
jgi:hypothetical protein